MPTACGSSQDRDWNHTVAVTRATEVTTLDPWPLNLQGTPYPSPFLSWCVWLKVYQFCLSFQRTNFFFFWFFRATPEAYGGSQARGSQARDSQATPQPQQHGLWAMSATYTTAHSTARPLTHWVRPGTEPATSWFLVRFISALPWRELAKDQLLILFIFSVVFLVSISMISTLIFF